MLIFPTELGTLTPARDPSERITSQGGQRQNAKKDPKIMIAIKAAHKSAQPGRRQAFRPTPVRSVTDCARCHLVVILAESDKGADHTSEIEDNPEDRNGAAFLMRKRTVGGELH